MKQWRAVVLFALLGLAPQTAAGGRSQIGACAAPRPGQAESLAYCSGGSNPFDSGLFRRVMRCSTTCPDGSRVTADCDTTVDPCAHTYPRQYYTPPPDPSIAQAQKQHSLGIEAQRLGDLEAAIAYFTEALKTNPSDAYRTSLNNAYGKLHFRKGHDAFVLRQWDLAIMEYRAVLGFWPGDPTAMDNIRKAESNKLWDAATQAWKERRFDDAILAYETARSHWPNPALDGLIVRVRTAKLEYQGFNAAKNRKFNDAIAAYEAALALSPDSAYARDGLKRAREGLAGEIAMKRTLGGILKPNKPFDDLKDIERNGPNGGEFDGKQPKLPKQGEWKPPFLATPNENAGMREAHANYDKADAAAKDLEKKIPETGDPMKRIELMNQAAEQKRLRANALKAYEEELRKAGKSRP